MLGPQARQALRLFLRLGVVLDRHGLVVIILIHLKVDRRKYANAERPQRMQVTMTVNARSSALVGRCLALGLLATQRAL